MYEVLLASICTLVILCFVSVISFDCVDGVIYLFTIIQALVYGTSFFHTQVHILLASYLNAYSTTHQQRQN